MKALLLAFLMVVLLDESVNGGRGVIATSAAVHDLVTGTRQDVAESVFRR